MFGNLVISRGGPSLSPVSFSAASIRQPISTVLDDTVAVNGWKLLAIQGDLFRQTSRFGKSFIYASHPEGKGAGDYLPSREDRGSVDRPPVSTPRRDDRSDYTPREKAPERSGGAWEKMGFSTFSLSEEKMPDQPDKKKDDGISRPSEPTPPVRDPSGELYPSRREVDPGASWGGGGSDGFGGGSGNDGLF